MLFAVPSFADYGRLSGRDPEDMLAGARVEVAPYKRDPGDFVLWKPSDPDIVGWPSPWGRGRPGWHIECSAMAEAHLGETIDIHGGGVDLLFPHHENELAQSTCGHGGKPFARYWLHNGLVQFDGGKMSKSLGNVRLIRDLVGRARRRNRAARAADGALSPAARLDGAAHRGVGAEARPHVRRAARGRDLGRADARAGGVAARGRHRGARGRPEHAGGARRAVRRRARRESRERDAAEKRALAESLRAGAWLLGLLAQDPTAWFAASGIGTGVDDAEIDTLVKQRDALRREKNFAEADRIRRELTERGIVIEDAAGGARWRRSR